jgi:hypothetical protein
MAASTSAYTRTGTTVAVGAERFVLIGPLSGLEPRIVHAVGSHLGPGKGLSVLDYTRLEVGARARRGGKNQPGARSERISPNPWNVPVRGE